MATHMNQTNHTSYFILRHPESLDPFTCCAITPIGIPDKQSNTRPEINGTGSNIDYIEISKKSGIDEASIELIDVDDIDDIVDADTKQTQPLNALNALPMRKVETIEKSSGAKAAKHPNAVARITSNLYKIGYTKVTSESGIISRNYFFSGDNIPRMIEYAKQLLGTPYVYWDGNQWPLSNSAPVWVAPRGVAPPNIERVKKEGCHCSGMINLLCRHVGIELPWEDADPNALSWYGGTGSWGDIVDWVPITENLETIPPGSLVFRPYINRESEGHIAFVIAENTIIHAIPEKGITISKLTETNNADCCGNFQYMFCQF